MELMKEGTVVAMSNTHYCQIRTVDDEIVFFNRYTKIGGCKFKYMDLGDRVLIAKTSKIAQNRVKKLFASRIELIDIEKKWNNILKENQGKYSIKEPQIIERGTILRPEEIVPKKPRPVDVLQEYMRVYKLDRKIDRDILNLYCEGKSLRQISDVIKVLKKDQIARTIRKYLHRASK